MSRIRLPLFICALLALLLTPGRAMAWNWVGHRTAGLVAWEQMTPAAKTEAARLLRAHPRYKEDLLTGRPENIDPDAWAFSSAGAWPDVIRDRTHPMHEYHRPTWHYVNVPFAPDGDLRQFNQTINAADWQPGQEAQNVLQAIKKVRHDLADPSLSDAEKAVALCWYLHLVADVHQPMHAAALVNDDFPAGDRGGNDVYVEDPTRLAPANIFNLHAFWDNALAPAATEVDLRVLTDGLVRQLPSAEPQEPTVYVAESAELAQWWAYLNGELAYAVRPPRDPNAPRHANPFASLNVPDLPPGYAAMANGIARRRITLAGTRMGQRLTHLFDPAASPPTRPTNRPVGGELLR